jgi:phosphoserine phosphatase
VGLGRKDEVKDMNLKKVNIELEVSEVREVLAIDMDDDLERALAFIKEHLAKQVKKCLQPH